MKKKLRTLPLIISLVLAVVLMPRPIMAQELTVGQSVLLTTQAANPYESVYQDADGDGYFEVPCTKVAWQKAYDVCGVALPGWGNAGTWLASAQAAGYSTGTTARVNSIAVFNIGYYGHVSFVTAVNGSTMTVYEGGRTDLDTTSSHGVATSNPSSIVGQGGLIGFIYFGGSGYEDLGSDFYAAIAAIGDGNWIMLENHDPYSVNVQLCSTKNDLTDVRQQWHFVRQADGSYRISSLAGGNLNGDRMAGEGTNVSAAVYVDWDAQRWYIVRNGNGYSLLPKYDTGLCLDVVNANYSLGTNIQLWSRNNGGAQIFDIYKYDTTRYPLVENLGDNFYAAIAAIGDGNWITLENHDPYSVNVQLCSTKNDLTDVRQQWHFVRQADGSYRISSLAGGNLNGDRMAGEGTNVSAAVYVDWDAQRWYIVRNGNGYSLLPKYDTGLCLDVVNANYSLGTNIQLWSRNNGGAQIFDIYKYDTTRYPLVENLGADLYANIAAIGGGDWITLENHDINVQLCSGKIDPTDNRQQWHFVRQADGSYRISSLAGGNLNGDRMAGEGTNVSAAVYVDWDAQRWYIVRNGNGYSLLPKYDTGLCLDVVNANYSLGTNIQLWSRNNGGAQIFDINECEITPAQPAITSITDGVITIADQQYTGEALRPTLTVRVGSATLKSGTDYTVSYANNTNAGTATVTVAGKGNYTGSKSATFKIAAANLSGASISGLPNLTYSGKAQTPTPTVTLNGATLNNGTDYTVAYKDNTNVGTATVTVTGKGNYAGAKSATFKIAAAPAGRTDISRAAISGLKAKTYTGKAQTQNLIVKVGSDTLKSGTDYTVSYKNNTKAGTATVVITGEGSYTGTKTVTFKINKAKQPMVAKATAKKVKAATAKKKAVAVKKAITVKKNQGDVSYKNVSKSSTLKKFKVNAKNGVINVPKGTAKGTYNVKVKVIAKGSANYESGSKTVTVKITVK